MRESAAYYEIAKRLVLARYPRWLEDDDLDRRLVIAGAEGDETQGDFHASAEEPPIADWRARRDRRFELFHTHVRGGYDEPSGEYFDPEKWQRFVRRLARFLMFVDRRRAALRQRRLELQRELANVEASIAAIEQAPRDREPAPRGEVHA